MEKETGKEAARRTREMTEMVFEVLVRVSLVPLRIRAKGA